MAKVSRKTKIVCTLGPATSSPERIRALIEAGMDVARLNFSHGDHRTHRANIRIIRSLSLELGKEVGILQDLQGPKIRVGELRKAEFSLPTGRMVTLVPHESDDPEVLPVIYPYLVEDVAVGDHILLADGTIELVVEKKKSDRLLARVLVGGTVLSHKGVNLPATHLRIDALTEKDRRDIRCGLEEQVDFVALSFIRHEMDLEPLREILDNADYRPLLIAKIEKPQAIDRLDSILANVDGVMVARGDLGVEMPVAEVPLIQKRIIHAVRKIAKPVITATQMLRSMVESPRPTRAEVSDVANAILDGTDAVMLSEETAMGKYPVEAVRVLDQVATATEPHIKSKRYLQEPIAAALHLKSAAVSRAACWLARDLTAAAIVALTSSGSTARLVASMRPPLPIVALTDRIRTQRQLSLTRGVLASRVDTFKDPADMLTRLRLWLHDQDIARTGDRVVMTAGIPPGIAGGTNLVKVVELEETGEFD